VHRAPTDRRLDGLAGASQKGEASEADITSSPTRRRRTTAQQHRTAASDGEHAAEHPQAKGLRFVDAEPVVCKPVH